MQPVTARPPEKTPMPLRPSIGVLTVAELQWRWRQAVRRQGLCNQPVARGGWCGGNAVAWEGDEARCEAHSKPS